FGLGQLQAFIDHPSFEEIVGTIGGLILLITGLAMWYKRPPRFGKELHVQPARLGRSFLRGFAINTFNPFPVFFWSAVSVGIVFEDRLNETESLALYGGILGTVVLTDTIKVLAARKLRQKLTPQAARTAQRVGAFALMVFGLVLFVRVWI
ncbi:MAG: LysE family transporter, partial [Bacteroidota bacterium]